MARAGRRVRVLIVDDDAAIREVLRLVLDDVGYDILEADDGQGALEVLRATTAPLVVLLDHHMPHLDGPGLLAAVLDDPALRERAAVVYMSATYLVIAPDLEQTLRGLKVPVLNKPFELDDMLHAVAARRLPARPAV